MRIFRLERTLIVFTVFLIAVVLIALFVVVELQINPKKSIPTFFGVELAYGGYSDCVALVDKVKTYTNLFVIGTPDISKNLTALDASCNYIYGAGLYFVVLFSAPNNYTAYPYEPAAWINASRQKYGDRFLGVYRIDEPGGKQLDYNKTTTFVLNASNYTDAATQYVYDVNAHLQYFMPSSPQLLTSDYGLYWFDYKAGYDTILAQLGYNNSRELAVALCRGAAKVQNKTWGIIITWTYDQPPYLESADQLYSDLVMSFKAGAKYEVVFDYPNTAAYGILTGHFDALKNFWNYANSNPQVFGSEVAETAYVLPQDFGFGFRMAQDSMWGLWHADIQAEKIWNDTNSLLAEYGLRLDIIYTDPQFNNTANTIYNKIVLWNQTGEQ
jgi:hypothetical protein